MEVSHAVRVWFAAAVGSFVLIASQAMIMAKLGAQHANLTRQIKIAENPSSNGDSSDAETTVRAYNVVWKVQSGTTQFNTDTRFAIVLHTNEPGFFEAARRMEFNTMLMKGRQLEIMEVTPFEDSSDVMVFWCRYYNPANPKRVFMPISLSIAQGIPSEYLSTHQADENVALLTFKIDL